jgi:hypothetical protein
MQQLLKVFWDIALWRRGPRDVPASRGLLAVAALLYGATSVAFSLLIDGPGFGLALARGTVDLGFTIATFGLCLALGRRRHRLLQTLTAALGTGTLVALPMIAVVLCAEALGPAGPVAVAIKLLLLPLQIWGLCVLAHIVRAALEAPLVVGIAVSTTYYLLGYLFIERLLPSTVG